VKDWRKTIAGMRHLIQLERNGGYPGGDARAMERWRILTRHVRPVSLNCLRAGSAGDAWDLFRSTLWWHVRLGRLRYILGFPAHAVFRILSRTLGRAPAGPASIPPPTTLIHRDDS
jgi:hypothetical protein